MTYEEMIDDLQKRLNKCQDGRDSVRRTKNAYWEEIQELRQQNQELKERILGLDKPPAEIVLKWDGNRARYNEYITAETYSSIHQKGWHPRIYVGGHRVDEDTWNDSQAEAQQWCAAAIKKLVTQTPKQ